MDRITKIVVPKYLYDFYAKSAQQICGYTPEKVMEDALRLYAGMISKPISEITKEKEESSR